MTCNFGSPTRLVVSLGTEIVTKKRGARAVAMLPTYCPFCGVKYDDDPPVNLLDAVKASRAA